MPRYLKHELHGTKVATSDLEVSRDIEQGWEEYELPVKVEATLEVPLTTAHPVSIESPEFKRRRRA